MEAPAEGQKPEVQVLSSRENRLLGRMELEYLIRGASGKLSRADLAKLVAEMLSASPERVIPVKMLPITGTKDLKALVYVYANPEEAKRQLPDYVFLRMMGKEERAKVLEERRKAKAAERAKGKQGS